MLETTNQQREVATVFISYAREDSPAVFCSKRAHAQSGLLCRGGRRTMVDEVSCTYWRSASYPGQAGYPRYAHPPASFYGWRSVSEQGFE